MWPWHTIFIVYKIKCCVIDWHVVFICYDTSGWKTLNLLTVYKRKAKVLCTFLLSASKFFERALLFFATRISLSALRWGVFVVLYIKVKWSRYMPHVAQRVGRVIALFFHDRGIRRGWVVSITPRPHFTPGKDTVRILQESGWAPRAGLDGRKNLVPNGIRTRTVQPVAQSLYRLSYRAHK